MYINSPATESDLEESVNTAEKKHYFTGSIQDLLAFKTTDEVFNSFKENELEFETYLRPLMQDVIAE